MMVSYAGAAEMETSLNFAYTDGVTVSKQEPIDLPGFSAKRIF
jgi:hypothetical protein